MTNLIEKMVAALLVGNEEKAMLRAVDRMLNSKSKALRENTLTLLVTAKEGCGLSSYGRVYSAIVDSSEALKVKGTDTFLELVFPKDKEAAESMFFASPRKIASIRNRYYGTMLISFKEYTGQDLLMSESFGRLLKFMEQNKNNIHFLFHILPEFNAKNRLISSLQEVTNIAEVTLGDPSEENRFTYVVSELLESGYVVDEKALEVLKEDVLPALASGKSYAGFRSLNAFLSRLYIETAMAIDGGEMVLCEDTLRKVMTKYKDEETLGKTKTFKIGFCVER